MPLILSTDASLSPSLDRRSDKVLAGTVQTTACLQVYESLCPGGRWWEDSHSQHAPQERAFAVLISALNHKDRDRVLNVMDPTDVSELRKKHPSSDEIALMFQQFESFSISAVDRAYGLDDMAVFLATIHSDNHVGYLPFVFARQEDGSFRFLLGWSERATYQVFLDWIRVNWGPTATDVVKPAYCSEDSVKRANYRVPLKVSAKPVWHRSELLLSGFPVNAPGDHAAIAREIRGTIVKMKSSMAARKINEFAKYMTQQGGDNLKKGWPSAAQPGREAFEDAIAQIEPFFAFDVGPLVVVYNKPLFMPYGVMYFTRSADGRLLWTNAYFVTPEDSALKQGALYNAASLPAPFSSLAVND